MMGKYQDFVDKLNADFPTHHFTIHIFPAGGVIDLEECEECGSDESYSASWIYKRTQNIESAIFDLKKQLDNQ